MDRKLPSQADDRDLFLEAVADAKRLRSDQVPLRPAPPEPVPRQTEAERARARADMADGRYDPAEYETGEELLYAQPGLDRNLLRRLRRGQFSVQAELDLHGMTVAVARAAVQRFLADAQGSGMRCLRIVHGKGKGSHQREPILKGKVSHWLRQRGDVLAFCSARPVDGGTGAVYVLTRRL
jgi:DNA-nicking Smr family endonuclease